MAQATASQTGGAGHNFEQYVQASYLAALLMKLNVPSLPSGHVLTEIVLQSRTRGWVTDDFLVIAQFGNTSVQLLAQVKRTLTFSDNPEFVKVVTELWADFNKPAFHTETDRLLIIKPRLNDTEKNQIVSLLNFAKTQPVAADFLKLVLSFKDKTQRLNIFRQALQKANNGTPVTDDQLWRFLRSLDLLGYDFLEQVSVDETNVLNLIKMVKAPGCTETEHQIWNEMVKTVTLNNPVGGSFTAASDQCKKLLQYFDLSCILPVYQDLQRLKEDSLSLLRPIRSAIGPAANSWHLNRPALDEKIATAMQQVPLVIITGKPGVGKSASVKDYILSSASTVAAFTFRADQFNQPNLSNVLVAQGIRSTLTDIFAGISLFHQKIIYIDSLEKLLENADPGSAFAQLFSFAIEQKIQIIATCRSYAVDLLVTKFDLDRPMLQVIDIPSLDDQELQQVCTQFPILDAALANKYIRELLRSPKYLDFTIKTLSDHSLDFGNTSLHDFKEMLWNHLVCNSGHRAGGLPGKRAEAFMHIALNRARAMTLFTSPGTSPADAVEVLEHDDIIFQDGNSGRYAPSHDILEDWALTRYVADQFEERRPPAAFFTAIGNEPAIRRAFRLWMEDHILAQPQQVTNFIWAALSTGALEKYWMDEMLIAVFRSPYASVFFNTFQRVLLAPQARLLYLSLELMKTACKEARYPVHKQASYIPIGSGWKQALLFIKEHQHQLAHLEIAILDFLKDWKQKLINDHADDQEMHAAKAVVLYYLRSETPKADTTPSAAHTSKSQVLLLVSILFTLAPIAKAEIAELAEKAIAVADGQDNPGSIPDVVAEVVAEELLRGSGSSRVPEELPDLILELADKEWRFVPPPPPKHNDQDLPYHIFATGMIKSHCWGIEDNFDFFPSGIYKTPLYKIGAAHPEKAINFIVAFINDSVSSYVASSCAHDDDLSEIELVLPNSSITKQWGSYALWGAYRGFSVTEYLLESLLMSLEQLLFDIASEQTDSSRAALKKYMELILRNSNSVMTTSVLNSVSMAYLHEVDDWFLALIPERKIYGWEAARFTSEYGAMAPWDEEIEEAQAHRIQSNQLPHRKKHLDGFAGMLIDHQFLDRRFNTRIFEILDRLWATADSDIHWRKKLHDIDTRKWGETMRDDKTGLILVGPQYEQEIADFIKPGHEEWRQNSKALGYAHLLRAVSEKKQSIDISTWREIFTYYGTKEVFLAGQDAPFTLAYIGLSDFIPELSPDELSWCFKRVQHAIAFQAGEARRQFPSTSSYYMEKDLILRSAHLLFDLFEDGDIINELTLMQIWLVVAPFHFQDADKLGLHMRTKFATRHPQVAKKIWWIVLRYSQYKLSNHYFIDHPNREAVEAARKKELEFFESLVNQTEPLEFDLTTLDFESCERYYIYLGLLITPSTGGDCDYAQFTRHFLELTADDLRPADNASHYESRNSSKKLDYQLLRRIREYYAEVILTSSNDLSKDIIVRLSYFAYTTPRNLVHDRNEYFQFPFKIFSETVWLLAKYLHEHGDKYYYLIPRFWTAWDVLFEIARQSDNSYFSEILLLDTKDFKWDGRRHWVALEGRKAGYKKMVEAFGGSVLNSTVMILSTIGSKEFLPEGLSWVVTFLKNDSSELKMLKLKYWNRLLEVLYYDYIGVIKKSPAMVDDLLYLLDFMVLQSSSIAYLLRENVISYKEH